MAAGSTFKPGRAPTERPGKSGGTRANNRRLRTEALGCAATTLFLQRGLQTTTIDQITKLAGTSKGSFYRYFDNKQQLVAWLLAPFQDKLAGAFTRCGGLLAAAQETPALIGAYQTLAFELSAPMLEAPDLVRLYLQERRGARVGARVPICDLAAKVRASAIELTETARHHGLIRDLPPQLTATAVIGAVEALLSSLLLDPLLDQKNELDPIATSAALIDLIVNGIRAPRSFGDV